MHWLRPLLLSSLLLAACDDGPGPARPDSGGTDAGNDAGAADAGPDVDGGPACPALAITTVATGMTAPILVTAPAGDARLFVVDLTGLITIVAPGGGTSTFLDLSSSVTVAGDHGLNGLAFHPDYPTDPRFFVTYAPTRATLRLASFTVSSDPDVADAGSETTILEVTYPEAAHTGGHLAFGPDGFLYAGFGDGEASSGMALAQDTSALPGKILRIDVDASGVPYGIPSDNPFVGTAGAREEIYAYGFRLPYRFSFDGTDLIVGEVGNNRFEEVDLVTSGGNYGWPTVEGNMHCNSPTSGCDLSSTPPIYEVAHSASFCAMMGGFVYRGAALPSCYQGRYLFADYCSGRVGSFRIEGGAAVDVQAGPTASSMVVSWGRGGDGELYLLGMDGEVFQLTAAP